MRHLLSAGLWLLGTLAASAVLAQPAAVAQRMPSALDPHPGDQEPRFVPLASEATAPAKLRGPVTLDAKGWTLARTLDEVARQLRVPLIYDTLVANYRSPVTAKFEKVSGASVVLRVLRNTGLRLEVMEDGSAARVARATGQRGTISRDSTGTVTGKVTDAQTRRGVAGAEVLVDGTRWRAATDTAGRYRLTDLTVGTYTLIVRRLGYAKQRRQVTVRAAREDTVDIVLAAAAVPLNELVTTATGLQRRRDLGNAITTIKADSVLRSAPIKNLTDLLEDRVPGMTVQRYSGAPGDPARIRLRGLASVVRGNDPVVVVDGVRLYSVQSDARSGNLTNLDPSGYRANPVDVPAPSPLDQIDPNIIDKIEVFKGPSAATMYGADAANGVIVITTKKGRPGPTRWSASADHSRTVSPGRYNDAYFRWGRDMFSAVPRFCTIVDVTCLQDSLVRFQALNHDNLTVLGHGRRTALSLTASGGTQSLTYRVTGTYADEIGLLSLPALEIDRFRLLFNREASDWMRRPHRLNDWSVSSGVTAVIGPTADLTLNTALSRVDQQRSTLEQQVSALAGTYIDTVNGRYYRPSASGYVVDTTAALLQAYYVRQTASSINFTSGLNGRWHPTSWFDLTGQAGVNIIPRNDQLILPSGMVSAVDSGALVRGTGRSLESTFNIQGTARKPLRLGFTFVTSAGVNVTTRRTDDLVASASGLLPGTNSLSGATTIRATDGQATSSVFGWFVEPRIAGQRFSLSTGIRLDGGSTYGTRLTRTGGGLFGGLLGLPKLNGSWVISEEPWFPFAKLFSSLQLRGAYGQSQVQPGPADRLRIYTGSVGPSGKSLELTGVGNTHLRPERSVEFEGGFAADMLDSRVTVDFTAYRKSQQDALMTVELPGSVNGGGQVVTNIGNIRNTGVELTVELVPVRMPLFTWSTQLNFVRNRNTLVKLGRGVDPNPAAGLVTGYPVGSRWAKPILGLADENGDGVLQPQEIQVGDSLVFMGRLYPNYQATLFTNMTLFNSALGITAGMNYSAGATQVDQTARNNWVLARALVDPSVPLNEQAAVLALKRTDYGLTQTVSTFRLNSFAVNYRTPAPVARLLRAQRVIVGLRGSNVVMHSTYRGKDPNVSAWSPTENIVDTGQLPQPRLWQISFNLEY